MATVEECQHVVETLCTKLDAVDAGARKKHLPDRTIELKILDLDTSFWGRIHDGDLVDVVQADTGPKCNVRVVTNSDDLIAMTNGELKFAHAWATGRIRIDASIRDLLRLRSLL